MSTGHSNDVSSAYHRFRRQALTLGTISSSFNALAMRTVAAYYTALTQPAPAAWTTLVSRCAQLVRRTHELRGIVRLDAKERAALDFLEAIVFENADLLVPALPTGIAYNEDSLNFVSAN